jgi:hypothetical protein
MRMKDKKGYGRIYRITPKGRKLTAPKLDFTTTSGLVNALKSPAINVRALGFEGLKAKGEMVIPEVKQMLTAENPYHQARAIWLLAQLGGQGNAEVVKLLSSSNTMHRLTAFRALKASAGKANAYFEQMSGDADPAVRREIGIALRDVPYEQAFNSISNLIKNYDGKDPWMLEAIGTAADGKEDKVYAYVREAFKADPPNWKPQRSGLAWRLHPVTAIGELKTRAGSAKVSEPERRKALTAIGFIKDKKAVEAMIALSKSTLPDVASQASYWINFRKSNDWADLMNWEEATAQVMTPAYKQMLDLKKTVADKAQPMPQRIETARQMASDMNGGNISWICACRASCRIPLPDPSAKSFSKTPIRMCVSWRASFFQEMARF